MSLRFLLLLCLQGLTGDVRHHKTRAVGARLGLALGSACSLLSVAAALLRFVRRQSDPWKMA